MVARWDRSRAGQKGRLMGFFELFSGALAGFYALIPSYGLAIILLTIAVRLVLLPLSIKQTRSMREMQRIQPEIKRIQGKYKGNRQKMNEEMMALYKEHSVNPFGSCLPLLLQFPVLIGLFQVVRYPLKYMGYSAPSGSSGVVPLSDFVARDVSGLVQTIQDSQLAHDFIDNALAVNQFLGLRLDCSSSNALSSGDPLRVGEACGSGLVSALPYLVLVALMGLTTWYQQKQMQGRQEATSPQAQQMQMFTRILPVMLMVFSFTFPTGVVLYWLTTNVWTIAQQRIILKTVPPAGAAGAGTKAGAGASDGKSGGKPTPGSRKAGGAGAKSGENGKPSSGKEGSKPSPSSRKKKRR
jgi:YidC/Oxa1 family membrane protein insertase